MHTEEFNFKDFDPVLDQERNEVLSNELNTQHLETLMVNSAPGGFPSVVVHYWIV